MDWGNLARDEIILPIAITFMLFMFVFTIYYAYAAIKWLVFLVFPTFEARVEATKETLKGRVEGMKATDKDEAIAILVRVGIVDSESSLTAFATQTPQTVRSLIENLPGQHRDDAIRALYTLSALDIIDVYAALEL